MSTPALRDDRRLKTSPLLISLQNAANGIDDPVYLFLNPTRDRAATLGRVTLRITAMRGEPFSVTPASSLSIYVPRDLLSLEDLRAIRLDSPSEESWTITMPSGDEDPLIFKPRRDLAITSEQPQTIALTQALATSGLPLQRRTITLEWQNFSGLDDDSRNCNATRELPPGDADVKANIEAKWGPRKEYYDAADTVYVTPWIMDATKLGIPNRLVLRIGNKDDGPLQNNNSAFTVTFPTTLNADARYALCTPDQLNRVQCVQVAPFQNRWRIEPGADGETRHWVLRPPAGAATVFGEDAYVSFEFNSLVTEMLMQNACAAVLSWSGITGHKSGAVRAPIEKTLPRPFVISFNARVGTREVASGDAVDFKEAVTLDWRLFAADACRVDEGQEGGIRSGQSQLILAPGDTKVVYPSKAGIIYTLTPQITIDGTGLRGNPVDKQFRLNTSTARLWADPDRFVPPAQLAFDTLPTKTTLHWVCTNGDCFLSGPGLARREVERIGQLEVTAGQEEYRIESIGTSTSLSIAKVALPAPFFKFKVERSQTRLFRLTWSSLYASKIEIITLPNLTHSDLSGVIDVDGQTAVVNATGNARFDMQFFLGQDARKVTDVSSFPDMMVICYYASDGPRVRWEVSGAEYVDVSPFETKKSDKGMASSGDMPVQISPATKRLGVTVEVRNRISKPPKEQQVIRLFLEMNK